MSISTANMDPYVYPGTAVLKNRRDIRDEGLLASFEADATARRLRHLELKPAPGSFDARHLQSIHHYIFQDLFDWAGEFRTVNIAKSGHQFAFHQHIASSLDSIFAPLKSESHLRSLTIDRFAERAAFYLGEINAIHPFREGNGRAQREFIRQIGVHNGWQFDWTRTTRHEMVEASRQSLHVDNSALEALLKSAIRPSVR